MRQTRAIQYPRTAVTVLCAALTAWITGCATQAPVATEPVATLHRAVRTGDANQVQALLREGKNVNELDGDGWTPLHHAAFIGHQAIAALLIRHGAKINARDQDEWTPLHTAAFNGHLPVTTLLLDHGADIGSEEADGDTPLVVANLRGRGKIVEALVERGARFPGDDDGESFPRQPTVDPKLIQSPANTQRLTRIKRYEPGRMSMDEFYEEGWTVVDPFADLIGVVGIVQHENITRYHLGLESDLAKREGADLINSYKKQRAEIFRKVRKSAGQKSKYTLRSDTAIVVCVLTFRDRVLFSVDCPD